MTAADAPRTAAGAVIELFAGAGGAAEGLRRAGLEGAHVEWDADACATLRAAGFAHVIEGDVRAVDYAALGAFDLMWASPPCQPFSSAGRREGATDERDGWPWTLDAIDAVRPRWFVAENVSGMTHHAKGHGERCARCYLERLIVALREQFAVVQWAVLDAADHGVPQSRRRLFVIGGPVAVPWPRATHARTEDLFGRARWRGLGEALGVDGAVQHMAGAPRPADRAAPSVGTKGNMFLLDGQRSHAPGRPQRETPADSPAPAMRNGNGSGPALLLRPSPCVSAVGECKGSGKGGNPEKLQRASDALYLATGRRLLTVAECATIQAFPPGWPFAGSKGSQYRQVGNAVPPPLAEAVVRAVLAADAGVPR